MVNAPQPYRMATANGVVIADKEAVVQTTTGKVARAVVMKDSPCVLSLGKRCMEEGYSFEWPAGKSPVIMAPSGHRKQLELQNLVPVLPVVTGDGIPVEGSPGRSGPSEGRAGGDSGTLGLDDDVAPSQPSPNEGRSEDNYSYDHALTHFPKLSTCDVCSRAKAQKAQWRRRSRSRREAADGGG